MSTDTNEEKAFRTEVRNWLKSHSLNITWLASWIEKSENTVRNFIYGKKPISKSNMEKIKAIMAEYDNDAEYDGISYYFRENHRFEGLNPNFDPSQNKINTKKEPCRGFFITEKTSKLICETHSYLAMGKDFFTDITDYTLTPELYEEIFDDIRYTIRNYMEEKGYTLNYLLNIKRSPFYEDTEEGCYNPKNLYKINLSDLDIEKYASIASAIKGEKYVDSYIESVVYNYLINKAERDFASFLGL